MTAFTSTSVVLSLEPPLANPVQTKAFLQNITYSKAHLLFLERASEHIFCKVDSHVEKHEGTIKFLCCTMVLCANCNVRHEIHGAKISFSSEFIHKVKRGIFFLIHTIDDKSFKSQEKVQPVAHQKKKKKHLVGILMLQANQFWFEINISYFSCLNFLNSGF